MKKQAVFLVLAAMICFGPPAFADDVKVTMSGCSGFQMTRLQHSKWFGLDLTPRIYNNVVIDLLANCEITPNFIIRAGMEGFMWFNTHPLVSGKFGLLQPALGENSVYLLQAENVFTFNEENFFGISESLLRGEVHIGFFPYKYNPDARNLGEYLFRSGTYPGWLKTIPFVPEARLTGILVSTTAFDFWKNDFLMTTEMDMYPFYDLSYTWITNVSLGKILNFGGGIDLARYTPANSKLTTRKTDQNDNPCPFYMKNLVTRPSTTIPGAVDTVSGDTAYYTFTGTKAMGRLSFDIKGLLPEGLVEIFGENDAKIYGEVDVLGLENQGDYYKKLSDRMPITFGINIPTFKLLDVLACEGEYYTMPYPNNYRYQVMAMTPKFGGTPVPDDQIEYLNGYVNIPGINQNWGWYQHDSWKWSVYVKRSIGSHFAFIGLAARDHLRNMSNSLTARDFDESLTTPRHWYWAIRAISYW